VAELTALGKQLIAGTLIAGLIFMLLPTRLGFDRQIPDGEFFGPIYSTMFSVDLPHNMVPSLHVVFSSLILLSLVESANGRRYDVLWFSWLVLICASTLFVHQHHLIDVAAGLALAFLLRQKITKREAL